MSARDDILRRIRRNQPGPVPLPAIPAFAFEGEPMARFRAGVERMGGKVVAAGPGRDLAELVRELHPAARVFCSATREVRGDRRADPRRPAALEDVDVGVVRARFGVAETGSLWLTDACFGTPALGFLAQHLVVLLDPACLVGSLHEAYARGSEFESAYGIFMTGPSATADIEGVLIHGAQGVRSLTVVLSGRR